MATPIKNVNNGTVAFGCYLESRSYGWGDSDGVKTITEVWLITPKSLPAAGGAEVFGSVLIPEQGLGNVATNISVLQAMRACNAAPTFGEQYDTWSTGLSPNIIIGKGGASSTASEWWQHMYCTNVDLVPTKEGRLIMTCVFVGRISILSEERTYPFTADIVAGTRPMEAFRRNPSSTPPATLDVSASDIGGSAMINGSKQGLIILVPTLNLRYRRVFNIFETAGSPAVQNYLNRVNAAYLPLVGNRNSANFIDSTFPVGTVVLESYNITKLEGPFYEIVFNLLYDAYAEHSQIPQYDKDGTPTMNGTGTNLADVKWTRPTRTSADLNNIFWSSVPGTQAAAQISTAQKGYTTS